MGVVDRQYPPEARSASQLLSNMQYNLHSILWLKKKETEGKEDKLIQQHDPSFADMNWQHEHSFEQMIDFASFTFLI